jgi:aerobactin synthase
MTKPDAFPSAVWRDVNCQLVAKALSELAYEELFEPELVEVHGSRVRCKLHLASGATYVYEGWRSIWGQIVVDPISIRRTGGILQQTDEFDSSLSAARFLLDAYAELDTTPATFAGLLREINHTLYADAWLHPRIRRLTATEVAKLKPDERQMRLRGHPKMLANKGRIGWGRIDLIRHAPEFAKPFRLHWLAADRRVATTARAEGVSEDDVLADCLGQMARDALCDRMQDAAIQPESYVVFPVHPWQWDSVIVAQYASELAERRLISLGLLGDHYRPQLSIRTLANVDRPECYDVKLSLSIVNTSVYRGIRDSWVRTGPELSRWLCGIVAQDRELSERVEVLAENAAVHYPHPALSMLPDAPYQYREQLGAIWRCSPQSVLRGDEQAVLLATFAELDGSGRPLADHYLRQSGLAPMEWLSKLFETVTVPLYHLLCRYGFCPIAHGQNVVVILRDGVPVRYALKDFHGDIVCDDLPLREGLPKWVATLVPREPDEQIVQNLLTAQFATTFRFVSIALAAAGLSEADFYGTLGRCLRRYQDSHPELAEQFARFDLFAPTMSRYCLNRVRLVAGYCDDARRPRKILGSPLDNPLAMPQGY